MLGRHIDHGQRRWIVGIGAAAVVALIAWIVWPHSTSQTPTIGTQNAPGAAQTSVPSIGASPVTTTTNTLPKSTTDSSIVDNGQGKIVALSPTPTTGIPTHTGTGSVGIPTTTAPTSAGSPTTDTTSGITTAVDYGAQVDPRFVQSPTNPLKVSYGYSASASILSNGQFLPVAVLPSGTLEFFTNAQSGPVCTMSVGGSVTSGTCSVTYSAFGTHAVVANYVVGGATYVSVILSDDVEPFGTTTVASIRGGGSLGGLVFQADITDANGNPVATGAVSMTITDVTQGWSYLVIGTPGGGGFANDPSAFTCLFVENSPKFGEYSGCGIFGPIVETPISGDMLTEVASFAGTTNDGPSSSTISYMMP